MSIECHLEKMKNSIIIFLVLQIFISVQSQQNEEVLYPDFLTQLNFELKETRVPAYLIDLIYNEPESNGITTNSVTNLYQINQVQLTTAESILDALNVPQNQVFSLEGFRVTLEKFDLSFKEFYNNVIIRLKIDGASTRAGLRALGIDADRFSGGMMYDDPDPWLEFTKGNFSRANLELSCTTAGITLEELWENVRDEFLSVLNTWNIEELLTFLKEESISQDKAALIWKLIPVEFVHVKEVSPFSEILTNFTTKVNNQTVLGVLIDQKNLVIHKTIYDIFKNERDLIEIYSHTVISGLRINLTTTNETAYENLITFEIVNPSENLTVISPTLPHHPTDLINCTYVTYVNNGIQNIDIPTATYTKDHYEIDRAVVAIDDVVSGSALICNNNTAYGITRGIVGNVIVVDGFKPYVNSGNGVVVHKMIILSSFMFIIFKLIL
ncbi:hypothetical protein ABEB36_003281 [Hypothenemus hampei]|uniref:Uncharacterized protein n=1 Tax=Hypothenemus hampei TaxID=57062 RepID=A0ABD1F912_HYPHA